MSMRKRQTILAQSKQRGQALLIVVLIMVIALTVGLSIATRSLTNTRVSSEQESSQRAFSAAEAGVERLLNTSNAGNTQPVSAGLDNNSSFTAQFQSSDTSSFLLNAGNQIPKDDGVDLWLSNYPDYSSPRSANLTLYWGVNDSCPTTAAAVEVVVLYGSTTSPQAIHYAFDPCGSGVNSRQGSNNFTYVSGGGGTVNGTNFTHGTQITVNSGLVARIIPLYNNTPMAVVSSTALPPQGKQIVSTGTSGGTERKISVFQSYPRLPIELFPYTIFSPCDAGSPGC